MKKTINKKTQYAIQLLLFFLIAICVNIIANVRIGGQAFYTYFDLTEEKRFTLTEPTRRMLDSLDEVVYVSVMLEGQFPAGFKRLQKATREMLEEFRSENGLVEFSFENPSEGSVEEVNARRDELGKEGIIPVTLQVAGAEGKSVQLIYPYAVVYYKGRGLPVKLLENEIPGVNPELVLNNSISLLEYKLANAIQKLQTSTKPAILFTTGHGELSPLETADLQTELQQFYNTGRINLDSVVGISIRVAALVVAKPRFAFSEKDKFKIDQYIMNGGKVIWLIDRINADLDSLRGRGEFFPQEYPLALDDLLFKYGIRIQPNLVLDMQCSSIPLATGMVGNSPQFSYFRYPYHPVVAPASEHPIVRGLGLVNLFFPSSIDVEVQTKTRLFKSVLLHSSPNTRYQFLPVGLDFDFLRYDLDATKFDKPQQALAMILEGEFPSFFANRVDDALMRDFKTAGIDYRDKSLPTRMLVVADGDIAKNPVNLRENSHGPLGYNEFAQDGRGYMFANKDFLINAIEYLIDDSGLIAARGKEVKLRLLDRVKAREEKGAWQMFNIVLPLALLLLFGLTFNYRRHKKYAKR